MLFSGFSFATASQDVAIAHLGKNLSSDAGKHYHYTMDLIDVTDDKVRIELQVPEMKSKKAVFQMPKIIPGTYTIYDFGRFISDFQAFDKNGNTLKVEHPEVNTWVIQEGQRLDKVSYRVDDTFDATDGKSVAGMSGTNIEAGKNFLINAHGFFGYFQDHEFEPFHITVKRPAYFAHQSAYTSVKIEEDADMFTASNYHELVDMPVMYCRPDTTVIKLGNTEVLVAVYSPNGAIQSAALSEKFETLLYSQKDYLDGQLLVERYAFLMYFMGDPLPIGTGALEHNYSSVYCLPEMPFQQIAPFLVDIASHEFFHIITPLNVHSEEIHYFDFNDPDMSRHLWMYEGVTEYFSHHNQVRSGMISEEEFLKRMGQKIHQSKSHYNDNLAFTELSEGCLDDHAAEYANVYQKGALIAMCMDIELLRLSDGKYGIVDLMAELTHKYGSKKPFKDKKLFKNIEKMTYPEIGDFLNTYVGGDEQIPYGLFFDRAGVAYEPPQDTMLISLGDVQLGYNPETRRLVVAGTHALNAMGRELGYQVGDEFISINGVKVPSSNISEFINDIKADISEGDPIQMVVARKDANGVEQELELTARARKVKRVMPPAIYPENDLSADRQALREAWLRGSRT
jgi:predicted metalloprotease with PDZ domain